MQRPRGATVRPRMRAAHRWLHLGALIERELFASELTSGVSEHFGTGRSRGMPVADALGTWCLRCGATIHGVNAPPIHWPHQACRACAGRSSPFAGIVRLGVHAGGWRDSVLALKYGRDRRCGEQLGEMLAQQWMRAFDALPLWRSEHRGAWCVVPVPMPLARRIERGIDHAQVIAKAFGRATSMRVIRALSQQSGVNQARLDRSARVARSGRMKWRLRARAMCSERDAQCETAVQQWVIVDDVMTTGATLREVAAVIHARVPRARIAAAVVAVA